MTIFLFYFFNLMNSKSIIPVVRVFLYALHDYTYLMIMKLKNVGANTPVDTFDSNTVTQ